MAEKAHRRQKSDALARRILAKEIDFLARQHDQLVRRIVLEEMAKLGFCYRYREWHRVSRMYKPPSATESVGGSNLDSILQAADIRESLRSKALDLFGSAEFEGIDILAWLDETRESMLRGQGTDVERLVAEQVAIFVLLDLVADYRNISIDFKDHYDEVQSFWSRHHRFANTRLHRSVQLLARLNSLGIAQDLAGVGKIDEGGPEWGGLLRPLNPSRLGSDSWDVIRESDVVDILGA